LFQDHSARKSSGDAFGVKMIRLDPRAADILWGGGICLAALEMIWKEKK
jgi:hypothetical protein